VSAARPLRVLVVEDRDDDVVLLLEELRRGGYDVTHGRVETEENLALALQHASWDILISDFSLPAMTAHDVLKTKSRLRPDLPCIVISGTVAEESAVDVLRAGARDFVVKDRMTRLVPAIDRELREAADRQRFKQSEESLSQMRERTQFALDTVGVGTWESNLSAGTMSWSDVMERLHGLPAGTFGGTCDAFVALAHPDDQAAVRGLVTGVNGDGAGLRVEYRTCRPDGSPRWMAAIGRTVRDESGQPVRAAGVALDVTAQKQLEDQFRQAQKMESIGNLAGGVAHDFNNLLTVILGECEITSMQQPAGGDVAQSLDAIRGAAVSAAALTKQLLTFSRRQVVSPRLLDLNETVRSFSKILRRLVEESVQLDFQLAPAPQPVWADPGQIEQVLLNLVANARDAMPEGGRVTIATSPVTGNGTRPRAALPPGSFVELSVADTGSGMSREVQARLFEPFFTTKPVGSGTGLGLATVHGIVKQSNGHISVQSTPGKGTTFTVHLPMASRAAENGAGLSDGATLLDGTETILVVEDNTALRRLTERILRTHGYTVLGAANGVQAQRLAEGHAGDIAVMLTDVVMPDHSGPVLAESIRSRRPATKVVYMSGYTAHHDRAQGHAFLQKPFTSKQLLATVRAVLV
jgi:two-component system, cell cycle sensor histidine kinase and response regulator CckA